MDAPKNEKLCMTREEVNTLLLGGFRGRITVASSWHEAERAAHSLAGARMLGFDTESRPSFRKGESHRTALLQLATDRHAFLFRLQKTGMPPAFRRLLEDATVAKVGQGLEHELKTLKKEHSINPRGFVDLLHAARRLGCSPMSVRGMAAIFLGIRVSKSAQMSNWERGRLTGKQRRYAATDAWVCLKVYEDIGRKKLL